jgi:cyclase
MALVFRVLASIQTIGEDAIKTKFFANPTYVGDPMNIVRILNAKGAQEILITDIESTKSNQINLDLINNISEESKVPVTYSGGINNVSQVLNLMALGVERIGINTLFHENPQRVKEISEIIGSSSIAFSLDLECDEKLNWYPLMQGGTKKVNRDINQIIDDAISLKIGEIHIKIKNIDGSDGKNSIALLDSFFNSFDITNIRKEMQVLISSGVRTESIIRECQDSFKVDGVILGSQICFTSEDNSGILIRFPEKYRICL